MSRPKSRDPSLFSRQAIAKLLWSSRSGDRRLRIRFRVRPASTLLAPPGAGRTEPALDAPPAPGRAGLAGGVHAKLVRARPADTVGPAGLVVVGLDPRVTGVEVPRFADPLGEFARAIEMPAPRSGAIPVEGQVCGSRPKRIREPPFPLPRSSLPSADRCRAGAASAWRRGRTGLSLRCLVPSFTRRLAEHALRQGVRSCARTRFSSQDCQTFHGLLTPFLSHFLGPCGPLHPAAPEGTDPESCCAS